MRLGDLDALTGKLKNGLGNAKNAGKEDYEKIFEVFIDWVSREPTISAVPVVRCRECKHYHAGTGWCDQLSYFQTPNGEPCSPAESMEWKMFQENDFCSMGQRKIETVLPKSDAKDESLEG